jgi:hypothetical protein
MADTIAIMGGEPFEEWIKRNGHAQRLYKAHHDKWPDSDAQYAAIGDEFYVRSRNGGMRLVEYAGDFDDEGEWCAQCGTPIDPDGDAYYCCDVFECDAVLCDDCCEVTCGGYYCPRHRGNETLMDGKEDEYVYPYAFGNGDQFTFGVEIEIESELSEEFVENVTNSDTIAGWDNDPSLGRNGVELQSNILDMSKLPALKHIVEDIPEYGENAGGHIHVARTPNQCASRWYWALRGLGASQCRLLNMRHMDDDYWCHLEHGAYTGKHTAVNDEHADTIELRTFDCWFTGSADKLVPAVKWVRAMWRFFEKHPRGTVGASSIEQYSSCMADNVTDTPRRTLSERLDEARYLKAARKAEEERERQERAAEMRRRVIANVNASRAARDSHGQTLPATVAWRQHESRRQRGRERVEERLLATELCYALPSRSLRPLHRYVRMATEMIETGGKAPVLDLFHLYHAHSGEEIFAGFAYLNRHGGTAIRVTHNIILSRIARASHGKPTAEPLERTALRLLKRAGRPELSERYARIRKHIAATRVAD